MCGSDSKTIAGFPVEQFRNAIQPNDEQAAALDDLASASQKASQIIRDSCPKDVALTAQDFGPSERRWRKWWESARARHREWLIEGLGHKDDAIREAAIIDLRRLTGEYFNYHHDLPKRDRDVAAAAWATWWRE